MKKNDSLVQTRCNRRSSISCQKGLGRVAGLYKSVGQDTFVTSKRDGNHSAGSLHYDGLAFDIVHYHQPKINSSDIQKILGPDWDVVNETSHIHCEYDPGE